MNTSVIIFLIIYTILVVICAYTVYANIKCMQYKYKYAWPVQHRTNERGIMQYSVDGNLWSDIYIYTSCLRYNNSYIGPGLMYLIPKDIDEFEKYKIKLSTMQECHQWNANQLKWYCNNVKELCKI